VGTAHYDRDDIERLNALRPHLARAALVAARLGTERAKGTVAALESIGLAAAVCANGSVLATNELFLAHPNYFRIGTKNRLTLAGDAANALLQGTLLSGHIEGVPQVRSIPLISDPKIPPGVLHVLPLKHSARELLSGGDAIVVFTTVRASALVPAPRVLSGLFDLSPAEAKLSVSLASGHSLKSAADASDIKFSTARSYLEQIFRKTGTSQQSQLVALLKSASVIR
jgi:DNA-binding CsgD family transcriptional regulator